jgi:hypothetical protein
VKGVVRSCPVCVHYNSRKVGTVRAIGQIIPVGPWTHVECDLVDYKRLKEMNDGYSYVLTMKDVWSGFAICQPLMSKTAQEVVDKIWSVFGIIGLPSTLHTDNGREFRNRIMKHYQELAESAGPSFDLVHGLPRTPTTQGAIERFNQVLHKKIASNLFIDGAEHQSQRWIDILTTAVSQYNYSVFRPTGCEPHRAFFGWMPLEFTRDVTAKDIVEERLRVVLKAAARRTMYHVARAKTVVNKSKVKFLDIGAKALVNVKSTETNPAAFVDEGEFSPARKTRVTVIDHLPDGRLVVQADDGARRVLTERSLWPLEK